MVIDDDSWWALLQDTLSIWRSSVVGPSPGPTPFIHLPKMNSLSHDRSFFRSPEVFFILLALSVKIMNIMMFTHVAVEVTASIYPAWLWLLPGLCQGEIANDQNTLSYFVKM